MRLPSMRVLVGVTALAFVAMFLAVGAHAWTAASALADRPPGQIDAEARQLAADLVVAMVALSGLAALAAIQLRSMAMQPLARTTRRIQELGQGRYDLRVVPSGPAELRDLAHALNAMALRFEQGQQRLLHQAPAEAAGHLLAGVAHEVNNPLSVLRLNQEQLLHEDEAALAREPEESRKAPLARRIGAHRANLRAIKRLEDVALNLRHVASSGRGTAHRLDINRVVEGSLMAMIDRTTPAVTIERSLAARQPVEGDAAALSQILLALIKNAVEAMPQGGRLSITTSDRGTDVLVTVEDTGVGVDGTMRQRLFDPFSTTKPGHAGLGLALARQTAVDHQGSLRFEPTAYGARFVVQLPAAALPLASSRPALSAVA